MADAILLGSGGTVSSDDLTAFNDVVVDGFKYMGMDTDDDIGNGSLPNRLALTPAVSAIRDAGNINYRLNRGAYRTNSSSGYPEVSLPLATVAAAGSLTAAKLLQGQQAFGIDGTATSDGNLIANRVVSGYSGYSKGVKVNGTLVVQSILSFNAAVYSSTAVAFTWQNPTVGPFGGVIIVGKVGSYPTSISDGTRWYKGSGNSSAAGGISSATVSGFSSGTNYYFRVFSYATFDGAEWYGSQQFTASLTTTRGQQVFTSSGTFTVPAGVRSIDVFVVGGGASGATGSTSSDMGGHGGNSGRTNTIKGYTVSPGQQFTVTIGAGGPRDRSGNTAGSATIFGSVISADGGDRYRINSSENQEGNSLGGSGYGTMRNTSYSSQNRNFLASRGGSNGSNGEISWRFSNGGPVYGGRGQGYTTRAFGEASGTLYAGGGSGGGDSTPGGDGGGGTGGGYRSVPTDGAANTGAGGGGGGRDIEYITSYCGGGANGICIVRWGY